MNQETGKSTADCKRLVGEDAAKHSHWVRAADYGYLWWIIDPTKSIIAAMGDGGNVIILIMNNRLVIAITAFKENVYDRIDFYSTNCFTVNINKNQAVAKLLDFYLLIAKFLTVLALRIVT